MSSDNDDNDQANIKTSFYGYLPETAVVLCHRCSGDSILRDLKYDVTFTILMCRCSCYYENDIIIDLYAECGKPRHMKVTNDQRRIILKRWKDRKKSFCAVTHSELLSAYSH